MKIYIFIDLFCFIGNLRKKLHNAFYLSMDRPLFRISNAYQFDSKPVVNDDGLLTNVHEGLPPSGSKFYQFMLYLYNQIV